MKPCPFCGSNAVSTFDYPFKRKPMLAGCYVYCNKCGAQSGKYPTIERAIEAWDERKTDALQDVLRVGQQNG